MRCGCISHVQLVRQRVGRVPGGTVNAGVHCCSCMMLAPWSDTCRMHAASLSHLRASHDLDCSSDVLEHRVSQHLIWPVHIILAAVSAAEFTSRSLAPLPPLPPGAAPRCSSAGSSSASSQYSEATRAMLRHHLSETHSLPMQSHPRRGIGRHTLADGTFGRVGSGFSARKSARSTRGKARTPGTHDSLEFD
jgi:hypothetical protein